MKFGWSLTGLLIILALIVTFIVIMVTQESFGSRCKRAYPFDPKEQQRCIIRLVKGGVE